MPDYRRFRVPGGIYFFTINLLERRSDLLIRRIDVLREAVRRKIWVPDEGVSLPERRKARRIKARTA